MKKVIITICLGLTCCLNCLGQAVQAVKTRNGLPNIFKKLNEKKQATIVFFGGSITNHDGYRVYVTKWLQGQYPDCQITSINAGIGGTGSGLGVFRMDDDVLSKKPDLVFIEFAVNDAGADTLALKHSMEGIVRKIWKQNINTDIFFLYTLQAGMVKELNEGNNPRAASIMEEVAEHYQIPSIQMGFVVAHMVANGKIDFQGAKGTKSEKPFFSDDGTHPTLDFGHHIYADTIEGALKQLSLLKTKVPKSIPVALDPANQENAKSFAMTDITLSNGWSLLPATDPLSKKYADKFTSIASASESTSSLTIKFKGTQIGFYDILGPTSGKLKAVIDNGKPISITRFDTYCVYDRANNFMLPPLSYGVHTVTITPDSSPLDKIGILKKKHTDQEIGDVSKYIPQNVYFGKILVLGELVK